MKGDENFLGMVIFRQFGESLGAIRVERNDRNVPDRSVRNLGGCCSGFVDTLDHEIVSKFRVQIAETGRPVSHHGVKLEPPEFIFQVSCGGFLE